MGKWEQSLARYDALVDQCSRFERKGKTMPYTSANGYMFSLLNKTGELGIRFSKSDQKALMAEHSTTTFKSYGAVMQGYILVTTEMLNNDLLMKELLNKSYDYVISLPPK